MEDTSYLFTEYGRRKEMECYELEMKEREQLEAQEKDWDNMKQGIDDCCRWVSLELKNEMHSKAHRRNKARGYLEDAIGLIDQATDIDDELEMRREAQDIQEEIKRGMNNG